jgi:tetratricopeptide (TPR) repeat protein
MKRGQELIKEAIKIQPYYTRYWIFLGESTTVLASQQENSDAKNNLLKQAKSYFDKASQLSPKHQEILIGQVKIEIVAEDYKNAKTYSEKCVALDSSLGECYFYLALTQIYLKDVGGAQKNIETAGSKLYNINSKSSLDLLSDAYGFILDYQDLIPIYQKLILLNPNFAQYHSSLAFFYKQLGEYKEARQEALKTLQLSPESSGNVKAFLDSLPR